MSEQTVKTRPRRPRKDSLLKTKAILNAAKDLFLGVGYTATSMDAVAIAADVSKRTIYGHFGNKEELFAEIVRGMCSEVLPISLASRHGPDENIEDHLVEIGVEFLTNVYSKDQIKLFRMVMSESLTYPKVGELMFEGPIVGSHMVVQTYFDALCKDNVLSLQDTKLAAAQFLGMLKTDIHMRLLLNHDIDLDYELLEKLARNCTRIFLYGAVNT